MKEVIEIEFKVFMKELEECLKKQMPMGMEDKLVFKQIQKNGSNKNGIIFSPKGSQMAITAYGEDYYQEYREGASVNRIAEKIISVFLERKKDIENIHIDVQNFFSKERIIPVFIPREGNEDLLKVVPHTPFENLEIIFKYALPELNATATVENKHLKMLDLSAESLLDVALTNGAFTDKIRIQSLTDLAHEISEGFNLDEVMSAEFEKSFYIVTNVSKTYGAAAILDKKVMEAIAEKFDEDVYILPSSIHECIVLPKSMKDLDELRQMVWFINHTEVAPEERLSDEVYLFDSCTKKISIAVNEWERKEQHSMAAPVPSFVL